jgi:hypothetical protein
MNATFDLSCALWHPTVPPTAILAVVGLDAKTQWSVGEVNPVTGLRRDRTYCRFELGNYTQQYISDSLEVLVRFQGLETIGFYQGGRIVVYFKNVSDASELYINRGALKMIDRISASIVFR